MTSATDPSEWHPHARTAPSTVSRREMATDRLRVVFTIDNLASGGAQRQVAELAVHLHRDHDVDTSVVVYRPEEFHGEKLRSAGVRVERVGRRSSVDPSFPFRLARRIRSLAPDVVHAFLLNPAFWSLLALRTLPRAHRPLFLAGERSSLVAINRFHHLRQTLVFRGCDAVTVNAERMVDDLQERLGLDRTRIHYVPNGIDVAAWTKAACAAPPWPLEDGCFHLALVGSYRPVKNHVLVLEALERLGADAIRNWRIWFVGDPGAGQAFAEELRRRAARGSLADVVRLVPATSAIAPLMARMHGVLLPSRYEGFPNAVLEAMALGVPVLASRVGDVPNLIEDGRTGLLLPRLDSEAIAEGLRRLHGLGTAERTEMRRAAREHVGETFALDRVASRQLDLYRTLLAAKRRSS
jgi:glycosyltransferase involved in cell wall biosynthesis